MLHDLYRHIDMNFYSMLVDDSLSLVSGGIEGAQLRLEELLLVAAPISLYALGLPRHVRLGATEARNEAWAQGLSDKA